MKTTDAKLTDGELGRLALLTATGRLPPPPPALPELGTEPTSIAMLLACRRVRLAQR